MKLRHLALLVACGAAAGIACQRIPASVSVPGYGEKQKEKAAQPAASSAPQDTNSPAFFPGRNIQ